MALKNRRKRCGGAIGRGLTHIDLKGQTSSRMGCHKRASDGASRQGCGPRVRVGGSLTRGPSSLAMTVPVISHNGWVDARQAEVLATIDPALLGRRIRAARVAAGMTQGQVAGTEVTVGYVSRIESGQRRPDGKVLQLLGDRVGASLDALLLGVTEDRSAAFRLELDFADIALQSGDPNQALSRMDSLLRESSDELAPGERARADLIRASALESMGRLDDAILALEAIAKTGRNQ